MDKNWSEITDKVMAIRETWSERPLSLLEKAEVAQVFYSICDKLSPHHCALLRYVTDQVGTNPFLPFVGQEL